MAAYPCQRCDQRFDGEARNAYLNVYSKDAKARFRYVICPACEDTLTEEWLQRSFYADAWGNWCIAFEGETLEAVWVLEGPSQNGPKSRYGGAGGPRSGGAARSG
jgi:hypothetical protein